MQTIKTIKGSWLLILIGLFLLSGCGFSFRGHSGGDLTGVVVNIDAEDNFHPMVIGLKRKLKRLGVQLSVDQATSQVMVFLSIPDEKQKTLSVDETGRPLEYELQIELSVVVSSNHAAADTAEKILQQPSTIFVRRVLVYDNNQLLAKSRERSQVRVAIYDVLIEQLIERIRGAHAITY